jgi:hypothetical protein
MAESFPFLVKRRDLICYPSVSKWRSVSPSRYPPTEGLKECDILLPPEAQRKRHLATNGDYRGSVIL